MVGLTHHPPFPFMTAPLTSFYCPIGRIRSPTNPRTTRDQPSNHELISWLLSTSRLKPAHGHKALFGVPVHRFVTSLKLSSTTRMISFQRNVLLVRIFCFVPSSYFTVLVAQEFRPRKRLRFDNAQVKDKFNLSNDQFYDVSKDGGRHRVRQTFGDLVVEHAYPAQKLQLPFVSHCPWVRCRFKLFTTRLFSIRHVWGSRSHGLSIDRPCKYQRTLKFGSPKCARQKRRRIRPVGGSVAGATSGRI
jgi:hypothetical protein